MEDTNLPPPAARPMALRLHQTLGCIILSCPFHTSMISLEKSNKWRKRPLSHHTARRRLYPAGSAHRARRRAGGAGAAFDPCRSALWPRTRTFLHALFPHGNGATAHPYQLVHLFHRRHRRAQRGDLILGSRQPLVGQIRPRQCLESPRLMHYTHHTYPWHSSSPMGQQAQLRQQTSASQNHSLAGDHGRDRPHRRRPLAHVNCHRNRCRRNLRAHRHRP
jgi:hypothetical protein